MIIRSLYIYGSNIIVEREFDNLNADVCLCLFVMQNVLVSFSGETLDVFAHEDAVYGLSVSPVNDNVFASSSDDGRVLIWDIRVSSQGGEGYVCKKAKVEMY